MQSRDVDFLLVVFENINFWLQSGYTSTHHSKGTRDSAQSDPPEAEEDDEDQADGDDDDDSGLPPGVNDVNIFQKCGAEKEACRGGGGFDLQFEVFISEKGI